MTDRATEYARRVVSGEQTAGKLHILACQRHLDDLQKQHTDEFPFYYSEEAAARIIDYAETLTIIEGAEDKPVRLIGAQVFDLGCTFGWLRASNDKRRFRRRYKSVARQNGKTFENGIIGTYIAGFENYKYGKLFTVATKKRQARLAWEEMQKFIEGDKELGEFFKVQDYKSTITALLTHCTIEALSREAGLDDGFRSIFSSIDEIHQHKDNKIYKAIYNGTRKLPETLVSMITTRGDRLNSFCKEMDDYCVGILQGIFKADDFFVDIYALDDGDDIWDEQNWIKANPLVASDKDAFETLRTDARTARDMGGHDLRDFMTKSLNMWVKNSDADFIDVDKWVSCGSKKTIADMQGKECWVGLDLSSGGDLTTYALEFVGEKQYLYSHSFMPRGRLEEHIQTDTAPYDIWEQGGLITVTGGAADYKNDYKFIIAHLWELKNKYDLKFLGIGYDPHNADGILADLEGFGCPLLEIRQSAKFLNDATVDMRLSVKSKDIEYDKNNSLLSWSFANAQVVENSFGEIKVDKKDGDRHRRIDPVDASINARAIRMKLSEQPQTDYEARIESYISNAWR